MERYTLGPCIGQGCFGIVHQALYKDTGKIVAIKVVQNSKSSPTVGGLSCAAYRELKALQRVQPHDHIVRLHEAFAHGGHLCMVMDLLETDLAAVLKSMPGKYPMQESVVKTILKMLLKGLAHIHKNHLIHRDLKPSNVMFSSEGVLKISDFGLARSYKQGTTISGNMTHEVGTKWYRAPELLLGCRAYREAVDIWSTGCVFAEMLGGNPLLPGTTEIDQVVKIFKLLGTPDDTTWPDRTEMPDWSKLQVTACPGLPFSTVLPNASAESLSLLSKLLRYHPQSRVSAAAALQHSCFLSEPIPVRPSDIYLPPAPAPLSDWSALLSELQCASGVEACLSWKSCVPIMTAETASSCCSSGSEVESPETSPVVVPRPPSGERNTPSCRQNE